MADDCAGGRAGGWWRAGLGCALALLAAVAAAAPPVIGSFTSAHGGAGPVGPWTTDVLKWTVSGATSVTIDHGVGDVTNVPGVTKQKVVTVASRTKFTLTATNAEGSVTASTVVQYVPLVSLGTYQGAEVWQTERAIFVIPDPAQVSFPSYDSVFAFGNIDSYYVPLLKHYFPDDYFMVVVTAQKLDRSNVPIVTTRRFVADGIGDPTVRTPRTPNLVRYNAGNWFAGYGVLPHEIGHNWGARLATELGGGHWLRNGTIHGQMSDKYWDAGYTTAQEIFGSPASGFTWTAFSGAYLGGNEIFDDADLYAMGLEPRFPTSYVLANPVFNSDNTVGYSSAATYDHAWLTGRNGPRLPGYTVSDKRFRFGFVFVAKDLAEVRDVYLPTELSIADFTDGEAIGAGGPWGPVPFLPETKYRASIDARLADLDGNAAPTLALTTAPYALSIDGTASFAYVAADADGALPAVELVPGSANATVGGGTVDFAGLPPGTHFFTLKAEDAGGKKTFTHFVVDVATPAAFAFVPQSGVAPGSTVTSEAVTIAGVPAGTSISVQGGSYAINGAGFKTVPGVVNPGDSVALRLVAPTAYGASVTATLLVGTASGEFIATVAAAGPPVASVAVASGLNPSAYAETVTFRATVDGTGATPTGTATFLADGSPLAYCSAVPLDGLGRAGCTVANLAVGSRTITVGYSGDAGYAAATSPALGQLVTIARQTIGVLASLPDPLSYELGGTFEVSASASSGLPLSFASKTPAVCTVSGATATILAAGTCTIAATQAGNANYAGGAITEFARSFTIAKAAQAIAFGVAPSLAVGGTGALDATATSGLAVTLSSLTPAVCAVTGDVVDAIAPGSCVVVATQTGNANFLAAPAATQTLAVSAGVVDLAAVGGGSGNAAVGNYVVVGGGEGNATSAEGAVVGGGSANTAAGVLAAVIGGSGNQAAGDVAVAQGRQAVTSGAGSWLYADGSAGTAAPYATANGLAVAATGGVRLVTSRDLAGGTGCRLSAGGGSWACTSDRAAKTDERPVDVAEVLAGVLALPLSHWRFAAQPAGPRHLGPMAQDFRARFGLGSDGRTISQVDADGVLLAALQGLYRRWVQADRTAAAQLRELEQQFERTRSDGERRWQAVERDLSRLRAQLGLE